MANKATALIIDDEPDIRELLTLTLERMSLNVVEAESVAAAKTLLPTQHFDLCFTDMRLADGDGLEIVRYIQQYQPDLPVAVITAFGNMEIAVSALKAGAFDFVSKPIELKVLRDLVQTALRLPGQSNTTQEIAQTRLLGQAQVMQQLRKQIAKLARSQAPVHISGESGAGKELVARLIHEQGPRANAPFVPVNCGAIPAELMESEFFGHKKGSFTGAMADKVGLFQAADGGTLFLDEVADLPVSMQVKLLRAIQEKAVRPIGQQREQAVDVRILSATHKDLNQLVDSGEFRQDLYYRINVITLKVPALVERPEDVPLLAEHILNRQAEHSGAAPARLAPAASQALQAYHFPGNIRELENILERAQTLCDGEVITVADLQLSPAESEAVAVKVAAKPSPATAVDASLDHFLDDVEVKRIREALEKTRWNKTAAAKLLGITPRALRYRLKKLDIQ